MQAGFSGLGNVDDLFVILTTPCDTCEVIADDDITVHACGVRAGGDMEVGVLLTEVIDFSGMAGAEDLLEWKSGVKIHGELKGA